MRENPGNFCRKLHHPLLETLCRHELSRQRSLLHHLEAPWSIEVRFRCQRIHREQSTNQERKKTCLLPVSLAQQEQPNTPETLGLVKHQPTMPTDLE